MAVLVGIALLMTAGVYGLVAGIVKLDDLGLHLSRSASAAVQTIGRGIVRAAPWLMKFLGIAGTAAMFLVGGGILVHGVGVLQHAADALTHLAEASPGVGAVIGPMTGMLFNLLAGVIAGAAVMAIVVIVKRLLPHRD